MHCRLFAILVAALAIASSNAQTNEGAPVCAPDGVALGGYDVVSYRSPGGPVPGREEFAVDVGGLTYRFVDDDNRASFLAHPTTYLPAYDGWCATTVAYGALRCPDFTNFKIEDGRLLFFEVTGFTNGRAIWDSDPAGHRRRADERFWSLTAP